MLKDAEAGELLPAIEKEIDQDRINRWAELSEDFNRLHVDEGYARETRFKGTIAHGPMSLAFLNELMMSCFGEGWAVGGRLLDVRFVAPIRPGDRIRIGGSIESVTEEQRTQSVDCKLVIEKEDGTQAVVGRGIGRLPGGRA